MMFRQAFAAAAVLALAVAPAYAQGIPTPKGASFGAGPVDTATGRKQFCVSEAPGGLCLPFLALNPAGHFVSFGNASAVTVPNTENGNFASSGDAAVSLCQTIGCKPGHTYATLLSQMTTVGDGTRQEIAHALNVTNSTGYQEFPDNINNGVEGLFIGHHATTNGAQAWGQATDLVLDGPTAQNNFNGWHSGFAAISEFDLTNDAYDCAPNGHAPNGHACNIYGTWVSGNIGAYPGTVAMFVAPGAPNGSNFAWHDGIFFSGSNLIKDVTYADTTNSTIGFNISGTHAGEVFNDQSTSPAALNLGGAYSLAAITTQNATTPTALSMKQGQSICFNAGNNCMLGYPASGASAQGILVGSLSVSGQLGIPGGTPATSSTPCSLSQMEFDGNYVYICTATNTWKRAALASW